MSGWTVYAVLKLDDVRGAVEAAGVPLCIATLLALFAMGMCMAEGPEEWAPMWRRVAKWSGGFAVACGIIWALLPTTKQMAAIVVLPRVVNSNFVQQELPADAHRLYEAARDALLDLAPKSGILPTNRGGTGTGTPAEAK